MDTYFDLGGYSFPITTQSTEAQKWFDRGILWTYGYNHEEAVMCFERAIGADPKCAMAYWGVCLLYTSPSPRDVEESRMPSSA